MPTKKIKISKIDYWGQNRPASYWKKLLDQLEKSPITKRRKG